MRPISIELLAILILVASGTGLRAQPLAAGHPKFLGSVYSQSQAVSFTSYFNQVTPENAGKWGSVEAARDVMNWTELDAAYRLAKDNGFPFRFHVLIWGNQQPNWIAALPPAEQREEIEEWFDAVRARYSDIDYLEVVNEPTNDPPDGAEDGGYIGALGTSTGSTAATRWNWVVNAYKLARQKFPNTKLVINEYNVTNGGKTQQYLEILNLLSAEGLVDIVGIQAHSFSTTINFTSSSVTTTNLHAIAAVGLPIMVTEMDIDGGTDAQNNDALQLSEYQRIFPIFWEHPSVVGITLWGYRPGLWRNAQAAYLVRADGTERPAMTWLRSYLVAYPPVVTSGQSFSVVEGWANGRAIGTVRATDENANTTFSGWTITGGTGASVFAIDASSGQLTLSNASALNAAATPSYTLAVRVSDGQNQSEPRTVMINVMPPGSTTTRLVALSARCRAGRDDQTLIVGFVVAGGAEKDIVVRGVGPTLGTLGVSGALADPWLRLFSGNTVLDENDNWGGSSPMAETFARLGMNPPLPMDSKDAALVRSLSGGVYTAHVASTTAATGVALVEVYDANGATSARFTALSTRTHVGAGEDSLIAGFVLEGSGPKQVVIRGVGPSLTAAGVEGVLVDPQLTVHRLVEGTPVVATNNDWGGTTELKSMFATVGVAPFVGDASKDAALLVMLEPGVYTATVSGANGTTGVALVEIYEVP